MLKKIRNRKTLIILISTISFITILSTTIYFFVLKPNSLQKEETTPTNIVLLIGDGMGVEHVRSIKIYEGKLNEAFIFEQCPNTLITTNSLTEGLPTDSAASATAMATGHKVLNGVLSIEQPGSGKALETILESLKQKGYSTGLVSTTEITHATPAAFASHTESRDNQKEILRSYFSIKPDIIFGGLTQEYTEYVTSDYSVIKNKSELESLNTIPSLGIFGNGGHIEYVKDRENTTPSLLDTTKKAISLLQKDKDGFFLMVEGGRIDHASHANDIEKTIYELEEFMNVVEYVYNWATDNPNTVLIVTADHETGGLKVLGGNKYEIPKVSWDSSGHTSSKVPLYICFDQDIDITKITDNTDIFEYMNSF
jgi:alkaline phosphatase